MPALRAHLIFVSKLADLLPAAHPEAAAVTRAHWVAALTGALAPDVWYLSGGWRSDWHGLEKDDPATWDGAIERWLEARPALGPGRRLAPETAAFMVGYVAHLGLDTWMQYQNGVQAALRALTEGRFPAERLVTADAVAAAGVPAGFPEADVRRLLTSMLPALATDDPWEMSRFHPWREMPRTPEARLEWEERRAARVPATAQEYRALLEAAAEFTLAALRRWW